MNDAENWEKLVAALRMHGYLYDNVKEPPTVLAHGENGMIMVQRQGNDLVLHQLGQESLLVDPTIEAVLAEVGRRCGAPQPFTPAMSNGAVAGTSVPTASIPRRTTRLM